MTTMTMYRHLVPVVRNVDLCHQDLRPPEFEAVVEYREHSIPTGAWSWRNLTPEDPEWGVLTPYNVRVSVTNKVDAVDKGNLPAGYEFRLVVNTENTGLQVTDDGECDWLANPDGESDWFSASIWNPQKADDEFKMVRCGRGETSNDGLIIDSLTIKAQGPGVAEYTIKNISVKTAWARPRPVVTYWMEPDAMFPMGAQTTNPALRDLESYAIGAGVWNQALKNRLELEHITIKSSAGVHIQGFRYGMDPARPNYPCRLRLPALGRSGPTRIWALSNLYG